MKRIVILGAGFGGLECATGLGDALDESYEITVVDRSDSFFIGFSKIDVLFGRATEAEVCYQYDDLRAEGVRFVKETVTAIDTDARKITTSGDTLDYDYLVVSLGADLDVAATPGFAHSGGYEFYSMEGAKRLAPVIRDFESGTLVIGICGKPYKCPPAPYEAACQLHDLFHSKGVRDAVTLKMVIPGPRPVKNPDVAAMLETQVRDRDIELVTGAPIQKIDADGRAVVTSDGRIECDLFIGIPVHTAPEVVRASKLTNGRFVLVDPENLETDVPDVYAIGDVSKVPVGERAVPKAGAFAEDAAKSVVAHILWKEGVRDEFEPYEALGACYFELGDDNIAKVDANYLGGEKPRVELLGPSKGLQADKAGFASSRRERWFHS